MGSHYGNYIWKRRRGKVHHLGGTGLRPFPAGAAGVLLVDGDAGLRSLDRMLGVEAGLVYDIADVAAGRCEPIRAIYPCPGFERLFLLPAPAKEEDTVPPEIMQQLIPPVGGLLRPCAH